MINLKTKIELFKSDVLNQEFDNLINSEGPLAYIINNYANIPAKGGTAYPKYKDTNYFVHVLNTMYIAGTLFEQDLLSRNVDFEKNRKYIKLLLCGAIMHDFNKLEGNGKWQAHEYLELIKNKEQVLIKIIAPYFNDYNIQTIFRELQYIILNVENNGKDSVNEMQIDDKENLYFLARFIQKGDSISSKMSANKTDLDIMYVIIKELKNENDVFNNFNFIIFQKTPQTLLRNMIIWHTENYLNSHDAKIVLKSPDWVIYNGSYDINSLETYLVRKLEESLKSPENLIKSYPPSSNQVNLSFGEKIKVTPEFLEKFMDFHGERLLLYQQITQLDHRFHILNLLKSWNFDISNNNKVRYYVGTNDEIDTDINFKSMYVKNAILKRMELELATESNIDDELNLLNKSNVVIGQIEGITRKTLIGLAFSFLHKEDIKTTYDDIINRVALLINKRYEDVKDTNDEENVYKELVEDVLLLNLTIDDKIDSKENLCIQCGRRNDTKNLTRINSFGIKATSGTGVKVSTIEYNKYDGKICSKCELENRMRQQKFEPTNNLCIQVYIGDFLPPVNLLSIIKQYKIALESRDFTNVSINKEYFLELGGKRKIEIMNYHNLSFIDRPGNMIEEFDLLFKTLKTISTTGIKVRLTPLFISGGTFYYTFKWDSAPSWVKDFGLDELRIDEINWGLYILRTFEKLASLGRGYKGIPEILSSIIQNRMNVYSIIWNGISEQENKTSKIASILDGDNGYAGLDKYEEVYISMDEKDFVEKLADIACYIDNSTPKSNNDNTWAIRLAFEVYSENYLDKDRENNKDYRDIKQKIAGRLLEIAGRRNQIISKANKEGCVDFGNIFMEGIINTYGGLPSQVIRRDIIAQFALLYNLKKWEQVKKNKGEKNE